MQSMDDKARAKFEYLTDIYYNPESGAAYTSFDRLYNFVRKEKKFFFTQLEVKEFLKSQSVYSRNVKRKRPKRWARLHSGFSSYLIDTDVAFFVTPGLKTYRFLVGIDTFDRRIFAVPVQTLKYDSMKKAFDKMFAALGKPLHVRHDRGNEFSSGLMQAYFRDKDIISSFSTSRREKAHFAENAILRIKAILSRLIQASNNKKTWLSLLPKAVEMYNSTPHNSLDNLSPQQAALPENRSRVRQYVNNAALKNHGEPLSSYDFTQGESVRILQPKGALGKSHTPSFSEAIYTIANRHRKDNVNLYKLVDEDSKPIHGSFKRHEILAVNKGLPKPFIIEEVLKKSRTIQGIKHKLVKWTNYATRSYIPVNKLQTYMTK